MRFKDYILNEMINFSKMSHTVDGLFDNNSALSYLNASTPNFNLKDHINIPRVTRTGKIKLIQLTRNPIYVELSDGTKAYFTYDEWNRIHGNPRPGKIMTIVYQRHPLDKSGETSKIESVNVH